jgi:WhiB family redox-sensing transcriptional regulator
VTELRILLAGPAAPALGNLAGIPAGLATDGGEPGELSWQERALCAQTDPEAFFPEKGGSTREAKRVCTGCEVRAECLEYARAHDERFGIWGGLSERERRRLRKRAV